MVNWNFVVLPFLNWKIRRKSVRMKKMVSHFFFHSNYPLNSKSDVKSISGTFICPRPPDYEGIIAASWSEDEWISEFKRLKSLGIKICIIQGAVAENTEKKWWIYYPISEPTLKEIRTINKRLKNPPTIEAHVLPNILNAAQKTNMEIHIGLFNCIHGWFGVSSDKLVKEIQDEEIAIAKDLVNLYGEHPALAGWYISPEIMYFLHGKKLQLDMNSFLLGITKILKTKTPNLPIGISPGSTMPKGKYEPVVNFWVQTLQNSGVDLLYPQDAVGQLVNFPNKIEELWKFWNIIAKKTKLTLWANCESFERASFNPPNPFVSASFDRFFLQLAAASPHVSKIICWECMFFLNYNGAKNGKMLEKEYRKYFL